MTKVNQLREEHIVIVSIKYAAALVAALTALHVSSALQLAETSPYTHAPEIEDLPSREVTCHKQDGLKICRLGGECVQKGDKCYSCRDGEHWSNGLNACYNCSADSVLVQNDDGRWVCARPSTS